MAWDWPIATFLFGNQVSGAQDWLKKYGWVFWLVLVLIVIVVAVWAYSRLR